MRFPLFNAVRWSLAVVVLMAGDHGVALAEVTDDDKAQAIVHMLDYVGVDYPESIQNGQVIKPEEYAEQREFAAHRKRNRSICRAGVFSLFGCAGRAAFDG